MLKQIFTTIVAFALATGIAKSVDAHVTLNPDTSKPESYEKYDVRIPVEKEANTIKVELKVPKELTVVGVEPNDQFDHKLSKDDEGNITKITWTAKEKGIGPNEFIDLPIQVANPEKEGEFKWEAYQTYDDGETVEWTGAKDSDKPAPVTKVVEGDGATEESNQSENGPIVLWIISIAAIIISIVAIFKKTSK